MNEMVMTQLIGIEQVANMTGATVSTVRWWRNQGTGPKSARIGRRVVYRQADVEQWINDQFEGTN